MRSTLINSTLAILSCITLLSPLTLAPAAAAEPPEIPLDVRLGRAKISTKNIFQTRLVYNVTKPSLTVHAPKKPNGTAVIICPGGGFHCLSIDSEGTEVAKRLVRRGVTCFILKYRLVPCKTADPGLELLSKGPRAENDILPVVPHATKDGLKAVRYVRKNAKKYKLDPERIGMAGFSAGGTLVLSVANRADAESRPDFLASIYAQYDWALDPKGKPERMPLFIAAATDDQLGLAEHSVRLYQDWLNAKAPVELHLFERGGHGFGMRKQGLTSDGWLSVMENWMEQRELL